MALVNIPIGRWLGLQHYPRGGYRNGSFELPTGVVGIWSIRGHHNRYWDRLPVDAVVVVVPLSGLDLLTNYAR